MSDTAESRPLVSVVVPSYNHDRFLLRALHSIVAQTHSRLELVVVDDCSRDNCFPLARSYAQRRDVQDRFERIVVRQNPSNLGAHATINRGVALARGDYVALINSDDLFHPDRVAALVAELERTGSSFGFSSVACIDDLDAPLVGHGFAAQLEARPFLALSSLPSLEFGFLRYQLAVSTGNFIFTPQLFREVGGMSALLYCHDWDFALSAVAETRPAFVQKPYYSYRIHRGNTYASLGHRAAVESEIVWTRFVQRIQAGRVRNPKAPSPRNWPGVFEHYMRVFGAGELWKRLTRQDQPYSLGDKA